MSVHYRVTITQIKTVKARKEKPASSMELTVYTQMIEHKQIAAIVAAANDQPPASDPEKK